jgi:hypothetical protein
MQLGHMRNEVFCLDTSPRMFTLLAVNQLRAPGTNRVKARAKLGSTVDVHAQSAVESHSERRHTLPRDALNVPKDMPRLINSLSRGI